MSAQKQQQTQNVPSEGILTSALNTAKQVAHTLGEKIGFDFSNADQKEFATFVDPLTNPKDLALVKTQLKHVQTRDKSSPVIEKGIHILQNPHKALFAEIKHRYNLKHTKIQHDASSPFIGKDMRIKESPRKKIFVDIREHRYQLKSVNTNDRSAPRIPKDVHKKFNEKTVPSTEGILSSALNTAKQFSHTLGEKTQQVAHAFGYKFFPDQKEEEGFVKFVDLLATPKDLVLVKAHLKHVQTRDSSKPVIEKDVHINNNHHGEIFAQIRQQQNLKHVKTRDASSPFLDKNMHIKESPQKKLFVDIREHHYQLKPVSTNDKSVPFIPRDIHIEKSVPSIPSTGAILEAGKVKVNSAINTAKQVTHTLGEKTQQAAHTIGEKTSQVTHTLEEKTSQAAHTIGEKTSQAAHTIGEKTTQAAYTLGEKTQQVAQTIGEKNSTSSSDSWRKNISSCSNP
jgi:hypothetical protein